MLNWSKSKSNSCSVSVSIVRLAANVTACLNLSRKSRILDAVNGSDLHEQSCEVECSLNDRVLPAIVCGALNLILSLFKAYGAWKLSRETNSRVILVLIRDQVACYIL